MILIYLKKNLIVLIKNLVDLNSMSVRKWMNQNSCRNDQISLIKITKFD